MARPPRPLKGRSGKLREMVVREKERGRGNGSRVRSKLKGRSRGRTCPAPALERQSMGRRRGDENGAHPIEVGSACG